MGMTADVLAGVRSVILGLSLPGLTEVQTVKQWVPRWVKTDKLPRCVVCPDINPPDDPERNLSFFRQSIPIAVIFMAAAKQKREADALAPVDWRDTTFQWFMQKGHLLPTVGAVDLIRAKLGTAIDLGAFDTSDIWWSTLTLNCRWKGDV